MAWRVKVAFSNEEGSWKNDLNSTSQNLVKKKKRKHSACKVKGIHVTSILQLESSSKPQYMRKVHCWLKWTSSWHLKTFLSVFFFFASVESGISKSSISWVWHNDVKKTHLWLCEIHLRASWYESFEYKNINGMKNVLPASLTPAYICIYIYIFWSYSLTLSFNLNQSFICTFKVYIAAHKPAFIGQLTDWDWRIKPSCKVMTKFHPFYTVQIMFNGTPKHVWNVKIHKSFIAAGWSHTKKVEKNAPFNLSTFIWWGGN